MFRRGILAKLPYLVLGHHFLRRFSKGCCGRRRPEKFALHASKANHAIFTAGAIKLPAGTDAMIWLPCPGTGRCGGYGVGNARDNRNEML